MSDYGTPPADPNQPPANPYGQQPAGAPYGQPGAPAGAGYAHWGQRVGAALIDGLLLLVSGIFIWIGYALIIAGGEVDTSGGNATFENNDIGAGPLLLVLFGFLVYTAFFIWNHFIKQGKTGYTIGKGVMGIKLIGEATGQPIGAGMAFVRQIAHILDGFCLLGYLWPLWDAKRQTFADKVLSTVVIVQPKG